MKETDKFSCIIYVQKSIINNSEEWGQPSIFIP